ncbi:hypothetical protein PENTCL1PPCAC_6007, partial [Pristionchus entomophagus]
RKRTVARASSVDGQFTIGSTRLHTHETLVLVCLSIRCTDGFIIESTLLGTSALSFPRSLLYFAHCARLASDRGAWISFSEEFECDIPLCLTGSDSQLAERGIVIP